MPALVVVHFIGVTNSYMWNKLWTFRVRGISPREFARFNVTYVFVLAANVAALGFLADVAGLSPRIGHLIALPVVTLVSYSGHRYWSFKAC